MAKKHSAVAAEVERLAKVAEGSGDDRLLAVLIAARDDKTAAAIQERVDAGHAYVGAQVSPGSKPNRRKVEFVFTRNPGAFSLVPPSLAVEVSLKEKKLKGLVDPAIVERPVDLVRPAPDLELDPVLGEPTLTGRVGRATIANGQDGTYWV